MRATFAGDDTVGRKIFAGTASRIAAYATAAPWLPPDAATTPTAGILRVRRFVNAPRTLNDPECCSSSSFSTIGTSPSPKSLPRTSTTGVTRTYGRITSRTSAISRRPTPLPPFTSSPSSCRQRRPRRGRGTRVSPLPSFPVATREHVDIDLASWKSDECGCGRRERDREREEAADYRVVLVAA